MRSTKIVFVILGIFFLLVVNVWYFFSDAANPKNEQMVLGVSFSTQYARYLGLDVPEVYKTILDDWKFRNLRLTARWDQSEPQPGKFDFTELDYLMNEAAKRKAKVILAMGQKTPRWPECNVPDWTKNLSDQDYYSSLNNYLKTVVEHYKNHPALEIWQVENEPFLAFGKTCRKLDTQKLGTEISTVKNIDSNHPVMVTDSGELSWWNKTAKAGDIFGTTAYRIVWNSHLGYFTYDWLPAAFYRLRAIYHGLSLKNTYVAELQAEPWISDYTINSDNISEQLKSMNFDRLKKHIDFAKRTGFARAYFWGAEWWYWLKIHGYSDIADYIKNLPK